jgi:mRNA interferase MazF
MGRNGLTRGDVLMVVLPKELGKPRPAVVIQSQLLFDIPTVVVLPCTTELTEDCIYRPDVPHDEHTGLLRPTQAMVDKVTSISKRRVRDVIGRVNAATLQQLTQATQFVIGSFD